MAAARIARRREAAASHLARLLSLVAAIAAAGCASPASSAPDTACTQGYLRCWNNAVQTCGADRQWGSSQPCANQACVASACVGACAPGLTQCQDPEHVQICDADGQWGAPWPCATGACDDGACDGATTGATSCAAQGPGLSDCGPDHESCCTSLEVPAGTFDRTYDAFPSDGGFELAFDPPPDGGATELADPATVSGFRLDKYDVTVGRFRQFVAAWDDGYTPPPGSGKHAHLNAGAGLVDVSGGSDPAAYEPGWDPGGNPYVVLTDAFLSSCVSSDSVDPLYSGYSTWTDSPGANETLPIDCVDWYEAYAFCIWDGGFLPSEAEWEYAAAGGSQQRLYPWGWTDPGTANQYAIYGDAIDGRIASYYPGPGLQATTGFSNIAPVGTAPAGAARWGQLDLAGEMMQWTLDAYAPYVPCTDCAHISGEYRVARGGSFLLGAWALVPSYRGFDDNSPQDLPLGGSEGFRCARTP